MAGMFLWWLIAVPTGLLFFLCAITNWLILVGGVIGRPLSTSFVLPSLGPALGIVFFVTIPIGGVASWWWLAVLLEPTWLLCAWGLFVASFARKNAASDSD
jgi:hypothetical protein